jgi:hypothetical protein
MGQGAAAVERDLLPIWEYTYKIVLKVSLEFLLMIRSRRVTIKCVTLIPSAVRDLERM